MCIVECKVKLIPVYKYLVKVQNKDIYNDINLHTRNIPVNLTVKSILSDSTREISVMYCSVSVWKWEDLQQSVHLQGSAGGV